MSFKNLATQPYNSVESAGAICCQACLCCCEGFSSTADDSTECNFLTD